MPAQEEFTIEPYERLVREIRNQLDEFPVEETVLVGNCPPDIDEDGINNFFHGFATAVRLKKVTSKILTTTLFIAKFDSAESASRSKVLHTLSLKEKKILLMQFNDRQLFGKNNVVELNGFQDHPEEVIYDHMSAFGQVNFILKTKSVAYIVFEEPSSVEASSRCEYLDQYPVTIRSVLVTSGSTAIESCILEQIDQNSGLLVEEEEGQINNFMQMLDMDNLDEYLEMDEREKSSGRIDKPLLEVGNEEIIANESEDDANTADIAAIEKQAFIKPTEDTRKQQANRDLILVDDRSAKLLRIEGNYVRLSDLPQLNVMVKRIAKRKKSAKKTSPFKDVSEQKKHKKKVSDISKAEKKIPECDVQKPKKEKSKKEHTDSASKTKPPKTNQDVKEHHDDGTPKKSNKDKSKKEHHPKPTPSTDVAVEAELKSDDIPNKPQKHPHVSSTPKHSVEKEKVHPNLAEKVDKPRQSFTTSDTTEPAVQSSSKVSQPESAKSDPKQRKPVHSKREEKVDKPRQSVTTSETVEPAVQSSVRVSQPAKSYPKLRKLVVVLKRLSAKQLEELSIVRRVSSAAVDTKKSEDVELQKHDTGETKHREKEKRKKLKQSHDSDAKKRKIADEGPPKEAEKKPDLIVLEKKEDIVSVEVPMEIEQPVVVAREPSPAPEITKTQCAAALLSDDEEQRLVIDLPVESKPEIEECKVAQPKETKPKRERTIVKLDKQSAEIMRDKVHNTFLLHLDVLSRVLVKLKRTNITGYALPKPARPIKPKTHEEPPSRKPTEEVTTKKREERPPEKARKTDLEKIDSKFLPAGSKLKSQAKAKSKLEGSHKKQHHVPVPELPIELKTHLNTSFKIPKKNSHSAKPQAIKHSRSELDCLHRADAEQERQRKRFQKETKRPDDNRPPRDKSHKKPTAEQPKNVPDFFDPTWDDDGGGGDASPLEPEPQPVQTPREKGGADDSWKAKKPFVPSGNEREKDKNCPSFREIWNLPAEKPKVWANDPWGQSSQKGNNTIDSGELWGSDGPQSAVPVLPLFARERINTQRNNINEASERWSRSPAFESAPKRDGNTVDSGESWSPGRAQNNRPSSTAERCPKPLDRKTIADGESWSPEADQRRPPSRQNEPQQPRRRASPKREATTISSGDMWDTNPVVPVNKQMLLGQIWENDIKHHPSKENVLSGFLSDPKMRGASNEPNERPWPNDRSRKGHESVAMPRRDDDSITRRRSRDRSPGDRKRRRSPERRPWDNRDNRDREGRFERSPPQRRSSLDRNTWDRDKSFNRSLERSPPRRHSPERRRWARDGSPRRDSPDRRNLARDGSPIHRKRSRSRSPIHDRDREPDDRRRPWSPWGSGVGMRRSRSRSRSPSSRMRRRSRSPEQFRQSPIRRGAARFRSRSRSRDRYQEQQQRKRSRSPPDRWQQRERDESRGRPRAREDPFKTERDVYRSPSRDLWNNQQERERSRSPFENREPDNPVRSASRVQDDDEMPYSPSNPLDGVSSDENNEAFTETIPLLLPTKKPERTILPSKEPVQPPVRVKQERQPPSESTTTEEVPAVKAPVNVKLENRSTEQPEQQRPPSSARDSIATEQPEEESERVSALGNLKQRAERLKKLEEMKLARQKLLAQIKMQNQKDKEKLPQQEEPRQPEKESPQPEVSVRKAVKIEPPQCDRVPTPVVADIKRELQPVEPAAATLLLETAVSILSNFGHLLPSLGPLQPAGNPIPPLPLPPMPPLPEEAANPPLPDDPPPLEPPKLPLFPIVPPPTWEPTFPSLPNLGLPPPPLFNMQSPSPALEEQQPRFQDRMERVNNYQDQPNMNIGNYQENNFDDEPNWQQQGMNTPTFNHQQSMNFDDEFNQSQNCDNNDDDSNWRGQSQDQNEGPDWQNNYYDNQEESLQLMPPEEFAAFRNRPQQFGNQRNRDPRQRFRGGNNRGFNNNNNMQRDPRRNRGGSIYAGSGGGGFPQQQQQQQHWNRNNNNFNRGDRGGFGNQFRNNQNRQNQNMNKRRGGFRNFQQRQQQQQQQCDEFLFDMGGNGGEDGSNWDGFMQ